MTSKYYCLKSDVTDLTNIQSKHWFKKNQSPGKAFDDMLDKWINLASETVSSYCNNYWDNIDVEEPTRPCPAVIRLATSVVVSNIIAFAQTRRDTPVIKKDDWNIDFVKVEFFTDDIKELIDPYKKERPSTHSDYVDIFTVSGDFE